MSFQIQLAGCILQANAACEESMAEEADDDNGIRIWPEDKLVELGCAPELARLFTHRWDEFVAWAKEERGA